MLKFGKNLVDQVCLNVVEELFETLEFDYKLTDCLKTAFTV
jgi:hypothetical protein